MLINGNRPGGLMTVLGGIFTVAEGLCLTRISAIRQTKARQRFAGKIGQRGIPFPAVRKWQRGAPTRICHLLIVMEAGPKARNMFVSTNNWTLVEGKLRLCLVDMPHF